MRYVALLRGINVGGNTMIRMEELRRSFEALGFLQVRSYINSGNIAFDASDTTEVKLVESLESAVEQGFGRRVSIMVRDQSEILRIVKANPLDGKFESHKQMHVLFLGGPMPKEKEEKLYALALPGEEYHVRDREVYAYLPHGVADSLLTKGFFEKDPRILYTGRNWRTVEKLADL